MRQALAHRLHFRTELGHLAWGHRKGACAHISHIHTYTHVYIHEYIYIYTYCYIYIYIHLYKYDIVAINAINIYVLFLLRIFTTGRCILSITIIYCVHQWHFLLGALWCKHAAAWHTWIQNICKCVYIYMYNYVYDIYTVYIYIHIYIQYIDMALYMNTIRYMQMDVHWQWSPKRNKKVETCRCGSSQFQTTWLQEIIVFHSTSWTCPARVPSSHPIGLSETLGGTPRNPYLVGGFNPSEKY